jgi:hypothetical protein
VSLDGLGGCIYTAELFDIESYRITQIQLHASPVQRPRNNNGKSNIFPG